MFAIFGSIVSVAGFGLIIYAVVQAPELIPYAVGTCLLDVGSVLYAWEAGRHGPSSGGWE